MDPGALGGVLQVVGGLVVGLGLGVGWCLWRHKVEKRTLSQSLQQIAEGKSFSARAILGEEVNGLLAKVSARREAASQEASNARFDLRSILAGLDDGVLVADHRCLITMVNPALRQIFGLRADPVGESVLSTLRLPIVQTMLNGVLQDGSPQQAEATLTGRGDSTHLLLAANPLPGAGGMAGAILVARDVSRLRRLEEMRREFVANVSHELRTPLSIFYGHLENLLDQPEIASEEAQISLRVMRKHSLRLNALVEDLLTLARLESGRDPLDREPIDIADFLDELQRDWSAKSASKNVQVDLNVAAGMPEVEADYSKLRQVLDNLLDNATKHTPAGGKVTLCAKVVSNSLELAVQDTGVGIPREDLPHIFERFYRADKARSRDLGGTGLGLAIVKHIAQAHGGSVDAESELNHGTRVFIRLPLTTPAPPEH